MQNISDIYQQRASRFSEQALALRKRYDRYSLIRLSVFIVSVAISIYLGSVHLAGAGMFIFLFLGGFYRLMKWHQQMQDTAGHLERMAAINNEELEALAHHYDVFPSGDKWLEPAHPYAVDLDIFGRYSLFQYCCRATTEIGQERLAAYFAQPAALEEISFRQSAVIELRELLDWRQHFRAFGSEVKDDPHHLQLLRSWLEDKDVVRGHTWLQAAMWLAPVWFLICLWLWYAYLPWQLFLLLFVIPPGYVMKRVKEKVDHAHLRTTYAGEMLLRYAKLLQHIENQEYKSAKLVGLKASLTTGDLPASHQIRRLSYIISQLNVRYNFFAVFLNLTGMWDLHWVYRLDTWKARERGHLPVWFEALQEFEALCSLANLSYNNPDWTFPEIGQSDHLEATGLGHPLIASGKRVPNDLHMPVRGHIKLITGSNMAGKSTFLRTVGMNIVLAQSGAPVCASRFVLPPLQVFSSMRTVDALHESTSSFYAELKRLKVIIEAVREASTAVSTTLPVFFLLDEILKGTNSVDRHTGSAALIRQLIHLKGGGLIATHDLELGRLESESSGAIENLCMEVEVHNKELVFDYKLKKGVSKSFNATVLMQRMGIDVAS